MKDPAIIFYTSDFMIGVSNLTMEERGQYITMLCLQHQLGHLSKKTIDLNINNISNDVLSKFILDEEGNYYNERLEYEIEKRSKFIDHQKENGKKGGRPKNPKQNPNETQTKPKVKPKQKPLEIENENEIENIIINENVNNKIKEWLEYKKQRKDKPYTEIGFKKLITQIENNINKYGEQQVIDLIDECMGNNYQGIIFDKLKNKKQNNSENRFLKYIGEE